jgi:F-type H+-transporting ATPase subunit c
MMQYWAYLALAVGLGLPIAVIGASLGQAKAAASAFESIARQPGSAGALRGTLLLSLAMIESLVIYALVMFFMLQGKLPGVEAVTKAIETAPK